MALDGRTQAATKQMAKGYDREPGTPSPFKMGLITQGDFADILFADILGEATGGDVEDILT